MKADSVAINVRLAPQWLHGVRGPMGGGPYVGLAQQLTVLYTLCDPPPAVWDKSKAL